MTNFFLVVHASLRRDFENYKTYKFNLIGELFFNIILVFMLFYISNTFRGTSSVYLDDYQNNYFLFLLTGVMVLLFLTRTFSAAPFFVSNAQTLGYFESLLSAKIPFTLILLSSISFPFLQGILRVSILFILTALFQPGYLSLVNFLELIFILSISVLPFIGISLMITGLIIIYKRATFINSIFLLGCSIFSGIFTPYQ